MGLSGWIQPWSAQLGEQAGLQQPTPLGWIPLGSAHPGPSHTVASAIGFRIFLYILATLSP